MAANNCPNSIVAALEHRVRADVQLGIILLPAGCGLCRVYFADEGQLPVAVERLPSALRRQRHAAGVGLFLAAVK